MEFSWLESLRKWIAKHTSQATNIVEYFLVCINIQKARKGTEIIFRNNEKSGAEVFYAFTKIRSCFKSNPIKYPKAPHFNFTREGGVIPYPEK